MLSMPVAVATSGECAVAVPDNAAVTVTVPVNAATAVAVLVNSATRTCLRMTEVFLRLKPFRLSPTTFGLRPDAFSFDSDT